MKEFPIVTMQVRKDLQGLLPESSGNNEDAGGMVRL